MKSASQSGAHQVPEAAAQRTRHSIQELQDEYRTWLLARRGSQPDPLEGRSPRLLQVVRAWQGIQALPFNHEHSLFTLGGYHGEPFRGAGYGNSTFWGGYCNHGNVLFPTWHRVYCYKVEEAMRSIKGCGDVTLPYWDETATAPGDTATYLNLDETDALKEASVVPNYQGVPWAFTVASFEDEHNNQLPNSLRSFKLPVAIYDNLSTDDPDNEGGGVYGKYAGYETVRYPYSGLVGTPKAQAASKKYNSQFTPEQATDLLNRNVRAWLDNTVKLPGRTPYQIGVAEQFRQCLRAPNYTAFSNTTSAQNWSQQHPGELPVVPLEEPHNHIHLAVGGFEVPGTSFSPAPGSMANGDMGENDTAAMDPIFFFHHCNIDRMFWVWQKKHAAQGYRDQLDLIEYYPGSNSTDSQGSTPGFPSNMWLTLETPLTPFTKPGGASYTSLDCVNIERQMGYTYSIGSLDAADDQPLSFVQSLAAASPDKKLSADNLAADIKTLAVTRINKAPMKGSFVVAAYHTDEQGIEHVIGYKAVLSRWDSGFCANCQTHLEVKAFFPVPAALVQEPVAAQARGVAQAQEAAPPQDASQFRVALLGRPQNTVYLDSLTPAQLPVPAEAAPTADAVAQAAPTEAATTAAVTAAATARVAATESAPFAASYAIRPVGVTPGAATPDSAPLRAAMLEAGGPPAPKPRPLAKVELI